MKRILIIIAGLSLTGAIIGGLLGIGAMALLLAVRDFYVEGRVTAAGLLGAAGTFGAVAGAVLAPIAAWTLMRSVPLWRAIGEPALGTTLGAVIAMLIELEPGTSFGVVGPAIGGVIGFVAAAVRLRLAYRKKRRDPVAIAEPE
jgi:hypothetical protein